MKTKRLWIVIALILIAGIGSTTYTKRYVSDMESLAPARYLAQPDGEEAALRISGTVEKRDTYASEPSRETAAMAAAAKRSDKPSSSEAQEEIGAVAEAAAAEVETAAFEAPEAAQAADETAAASPESEALTPEAETSRLVVAGTGRDMEAGSYRKRLEDLDEQIEINRSADTENSVNYSVKVRADNERKLWESELDGIMSLLEERLDEGQKEPLFKEQREWQRERETKALEASKKKSGSSLEEVAYTLSITELTRARAYELAEQYADILSGS